MKNEREWNEKPSDWEKKKKKTNGVCVFSYVTLCSSVVMRLNQKIQ